MRDDLLTILCGDALAILKTLPDESVHAWVTSPPYWGLRDYKIEPTTWPDGWVGVFGLEPTPELYIEHAVMIFREARRVLRDDGTLWVNLGDSYANDTKWGGASGGKNYTSFLGGYQGQRVRRNLDCDPKRGRAAPGQPMKHGGAAGLKPGDLVGIPWRVALALQADGWFLRRDNIWFKPNPMPESVNGWRWEQHRIKVAHGKATQHKPSGWDTSNGTHSGVAKGRHGSEMEASFESCPGCDKCAPNGGLVLRKGNWRCTTSHEYVFQFSKTESYFCDAEAARERTTGNAHGRGSGVNPKAKTPGRNSRLHVDRDVAHAGGKTKRSRQNESFSAAVSGLVSNRNRRSVWSIATAPYRDAHFATFPPALVRPIIMAASPVKCCAACGAPYAPVIERGEPRREQQLACGGSKLNGSYSGSATKNFEVNGAENASEVKTRILAGMVEKWVVGYRATCKCGADSIPAVVADMFGGSGTVGMVAMQEGRKAILIELNPDYCELAKQRCAVTPGLPL